jgi:sugar/nucleoside kinase (ribokinase family)
MKNHSSNLLVIGSVAYDSIETPFGKADKALGGSATYFSLAASYFVKPSVVAVVGEDFNSFDVFKKKQIDVSGIQKQKGKTFHWAGKYHFDLNTRDTLKTSLGVFADFKPKLNDIQQSAEYIFLGNIHPSLQLDVLKQIKQPKLVGLDTMNLWIETALPDLKKILKMINVFVINDSEARQLTKEHNVYKAAKKILGMMAQKNKTLIIKRGEYGLLLFSRPSSLRGEAQHTTKQSLKDNRLLRSARNDEQNNQIFHLPGLPLEDVADPTGAGDSFAGGLFGYLATKDKLTINDLKHACIYGTAMASFCVQDFGTKALQNLKQSQINNRVKQLHNLVKL